MRGEDGDVEEQVDLLTFEEGLTGHPLQGDVYVCVNGPKTEAHAVGVTE